MGTTTILNELDTMTQKHKPCIIVLTETKLTEQSQNRKLLEPYLPHYKIYHSRVKGQVNKGLRSDHAGVAIAMHDLHVAAGHCFLLHSLLLHQAAAASSAQELQLFGGMTCMADLSILFIENCRSVTVICIVCQ